MKAGAHAAMHDEVADTMGVETVTADTNVSSVADEVGADDKAMSSPITPKENQEQDEVQGAGRMKVGLLDAFVLREGTIFQSARLTEDERAVVKAAIAGRRFTLGLCFENAQRILETDATDRLVYCEGFIGTTLHAWLTIGERVIDPTALPSSATIKRAWAAKRRARARMILGEFDEEREYHGVRFDRAFVLGTIRERMFAAMSRGERTHNVSMIDDWQAGYPIARGLVTGWRYTP
jgi:hypothetical protein